MARDTPQHWSWYRRVLLGTVVELLRDTGIGIDVSSIEMAFGQGSEFNFPALHSVVRFEGRFAGRLLQHPDEATQARLRETFAAAWPDLVSVLRVPLLPPMPITRNEVSVEIEGQHLVIRFDLAAGS